MVKEALPGRIAAVSSFGAEAAVMLKLVADADPAVPVIFIDTQKHFPETLAYRDALVARLGLRDARTVRPDPRTLARSDPDGKLWQRAPDACCFSRKVEPLQRALAGFDAWFTGRKRFHGGERSALRCIEVRDGRIKVNPLTGWTSDQVTAAFETFDLPRHPLVPAGYLSIGCAACTVKSSSRAQPRSGRWSLVGQPEDRMRPSLAKQVVTWPRDDRFISRDLIRSAATPAGVAG